MKQTHILNPIHYKSIAMILVHHCVKIDVQIDYVNYIN